MAHWRYPQQARSSLLEGRLLVIFSLNKEGSLTRLDISESSGHEILDREAAGAIRDASPFPPFPEHITVTRLNVRASFDYQLKAKRSRRTEGRSQKTDEKKE
jgi:protein TonB